jgi:type VI secretion system protein VasG
LHNLELEHKLLTQENQNLPIHHTRLNELSVKTAAIKQSIQCLEHQWQHELHIVQQIREFQAKDQDEKSSQKIAVLRAELAEVQQKNPLVFERVNASIIHATGSTVRSAYVPRTPV